MGRGEGKGEPSARTTLKGAASRFFNTRATASEATGDRASAAIENLNDVVLQALGFEPNRQVLDLVRKLAERAKWAEGRYLAVDLDAALERNDAKAKGELETIAALFSADALLPGGTDGDGAQSALDELVDKSHKHAVGVSKALREGIRDSIEILANEVIAQRLATGKAVYNKQSGIDANELTSQCLRYLYRLLVLLYAESRPELGIVPANDETYTEGYSLDRLRELCQVDLDTEVSRNGTHLNESLTGLFELVNKGYHAETGLRHFGSKATLLDRYTYVRCLSVRQGGRHGIHRTASDARSERCPIEPSPHSKTGSAHPRRGIRCRQAGERVHPGRIHGRS